MSHVESEAIGRVAEHWSCRYIGRAVTDEFDCAELARLVNREVFGREIRIPTLRDRRGKVRVTQRFAAQQAQIARSLPDCAEPTQEPEEGDGVLLWCRGYLQHVGIYCVVDGERCVLHAADFKVGPQVVRTRLRELAIRGMKLERFYKWT